MTAEFEQLCLIFFPLGSKLVLLILGGQHGSKLTCEDGLSFTQVMKYGSNIKVCLVQEVNQQAIQVLRKWKFQPYKSEDDQEVLKVLLEAQKHQELDFHVRLLGVLVKQIGSFGPSLHAVAAEIATRAVRKDRQVNPQQAFDADSCKA